MYSRRGVNILALLVMVFFISGFSADKFSRSEFYKVFAEDYLNEMERMSKKIEGLSDVDAYQGALFMKISEQLNGVSTKLKTFKKGRELLETAIDEEPNNAEWRFLRHAVQENAPSIVGYDNNMEGDKVIIINNFSSFDIDIQTVIRNYAEKSKSLKPGDLPKSR